MGWTPAPAAAWPRSFSPASRQSSPAPWSSSPLAPAALTSAAVAALQGNATLKTQITEAKTTNDSLMVERSALSSNARISRIATQNLGMVLSTDTETVTIGAADAASSAAASDEVAAQADGDAAQSASEDASVQGVA